VIALRTVANRFEEVVVARVVVPDTLKFPVAVAFDPLARNPVFSTQLTPSHLSVESVTVPEAREPPADTLIHLVEVPVLESTCPVVPVALNESRRKPPNERLVIVAFVPTRFVKNPVVAFRSVEKKLVEVALVIVAFVPKMPVEVSAVAEALARVV
jgi:hypothetical protein